MKNSILLLVISLGFIFQAQAQQSWTIDTKKSEISWIGGKKVVNEKHNGTIEVKEGEVETDAEGNLKSGKIVIDMNSIKNEDVKNAKYRDKLVAHLKSEDFFNTDSHPTAVFEIKSVEKVVEAKAEEVLQTEAKENSVQYNVKGDLTIRDKKNKVEIPMEVQKMGKNLLASGGFKFDRTLWNVKYGSGKFFKGLGDKIIKDEIEINFKLVANSKGKATPASKKAKK